jgi:hypothetical protein
VLACWYNWRIYNVRRSLSMHLSMRRCVFFSSPHVRPASASCHSCLLLALDLVGGLLDVVSVRSLASMLGLANRVLRAGPRLPVRGYTHFTKLSSALLFALMGGEVGSSAFLPPMASAAPVKVVARVAIASCSDVVSPSPSTHLRCQSCPSNLLEPLQASNFLFLCAMDSRGISKAPSYIHRTFPPHSFGEEHTTCDPTWRPIIVYIATMFAVFEDSSVRRGDDATAMDGGAWSSRVKLVVLRGARSEEKTRLGGVAGAVAEVR